MFSVVSEVMVIFKDRQLFLLPYRWPNPLSFASSPSPLDWEVGHLGSSLSCAIYYYVIALLKTSTSFLSHGHKR